MTQTVGSNRISNNAITTDKISNYSVTNVKLANNTITIDNISLTALPIYDLDDISYSADGFTNLFPLTYNTSNVSVPSPWNLMVTIDGQTQAAFANNYDMVWLSSVLSASKGYTLDDSGNIKFARTVPQGSDILIRLVPGITNVNTKVYPFKPTDILMGY
jgi:hypothetical protein